MKTVYIHAGSPKTGTTYLQNYFALNREYLKQNNIIYPEFEFKSHIFYNQTIPLNVLFRPDPDPPSWYKRALAIHDYSDFRYRVKRILHNLLTSNPNCNFLFSDEFLFRMPLKQHNFLINFFKKYNFEVKICVYIRDPSSLLISRIIQRSPMHYIDWRDITIKVAAAIKNQLSSSRLSQYDFIFSYNEACTKTSLPAHFYKFFLSIPPYEKTIEGIAKNQSICLEAHDILQHLNKYQKNLTRIDNLAMTDYINNYSTLKRIPGERFKPSKDIYAILKPCIAELNLVYAKVLGKEFIAKDSKFATKEVSWNIEQLEYIKNNMHLFYERNKPIINEYFEQTTFKGERERHYYENQIRPYLQRNKFTPSMNLAFIYKFIRLLVLSRGHNRLSFYLVSFLKFLKLVKNV